ncbi:hypothetical protein GCM10027059_19750 [Myceligenerans halotolerans]
MLDHESARRLRAHAQALAGGAWEVSAEAVVRRVFAIQAQDATAADLGIRVRGRDITAQAIRTAYEDERSIVRNWCMRGTLHTIPSDDARWVLQLLAPRILGRHGESDDVVDTGIRQRCRAPWGAGGSGCSGPPALSPAAGRPWSGTRRSGRGSRGRCRSRPTCRAGCG